MAACSSRADEYLHEHLALKGGTAINMIIFNLPRLSVDLDLDFTPNLPLEDMKKAREKIAEMLKRYMTEEGYFLSESSRYSHSLDSMLFQYQNAGGNKVNPHFEEQMIDQLNKLPLLKLEYKFLDAYLISTYKNLSIWFQIREDDLTAWGYILFWMSYRKIYLNEFSTNNLDWNSNLERTINYVLGISKQRWFNARNKIVEDILPVVFKENGVIYFEITDNEVFALINVLLGNEQGEPRPRVMKMVSIC